MSAIPNILNNPAVDRSQDNANSVARKEIENEQQRKQQQQDALMLAFLQVLESVNVQSQSAQTEVKVLEANGQAQQKMNSQAGALNFQQLSWNELYGRVRFDQSHLLFGAMAMGGSQLTANAQAKFEAWAKNGGKGDLTLTFKKKVSATQLQNLQDGNQEVEKQRTYVANQIMLLQQNAQIGETGLNSTINSQQQSSQIDSGLMNMLSQLTQKIASAAR